MSCLLDAATTKSCKFTLTQIVEVWLANFDEIVSWTPGVSGYSDVTMAGSVEEGFAGFYKMAFESTVDTYNSQLTLNGAFKYIMQTLNLSLTESSAANREIYEKLFLGKMVAIVKRTDGKYLILGKDTGLEATDGTDAGGADTGGLTVVLSGRSVELNPEFTGTIPEPIAPVVP